MNCAVAYALGITASIIGINAWKDLKTGKTEFTLLYPRWPVWWLPLSQVEIE